LKKCYLGKKMKRKEKERISKLHPIETARWNKENLERFLVFCMLDRAMPYEKVCRAFDALNRKDLTLRKNLKKVSLDEIVETLRKEGFRFPNQTAKFLKAFGDNPIDLSTATREELTKIPGIGMKLASMFLRNTRGSEFAVIDVHVRNFLREHNALGKDYLESERNFKEIARKLGKTIHELDFEIWEKRRVGNRRRKSC